MRQNNVDPDIDIDIKHVVGEKNCLVDKVSLGWPRLTLDETKFPLTLMPSLVCRLYCWWKNYPCNTSRHTIYV